MQQTLKSNTEARTMEKKQYLKSQSLQFTYSLLRDTGKQADNDNIAWQDAITRELDDALVT